MIESILEREWKDVEKAVFLRFLDKEYLLDNF